MEKVTVPRIREMKEKGKKMRSPAPTRAPRNTAFQHSCTQCQLSFVSSQRNGEPVVEDV